MAKIEQTIEVDAPVRTAYNQLTRFEQYPRFLDDVKEVRQLDETHLHWHTRAGNLDLEWDTEITQQIPDRCIAWRTTSGPRYEGKIELKTAEKDRTRLTLTMECDARQQLLAQHGDAEDAIAQRTGHDLARFKKFIERLVGKDGKGDELRAAAAAPAATDRSDRTDRSSGALIGKAIGQTAGERQDAARSGEPANVPRPPQSAQEGQVGGAEGQAGRAPWLPGLPGLLQAWNEPFGLMRKMTEDMDQMIHNYIGRPLNDARLRATSTTGWTPPVEVAQRGRQFVVCAELPGVRREDVQIEIQRDRVTIEGERLQEPPHEASEYRRSERSYGHFYRVIALPPGADPEAASASMRDGMLEITVPMPGNGKQGRKLEIQAPQ